MSGIKTEEIFLTALQRKYLKIKISTINIERHIVDFIHQFLPLESIVAKKM